MKQLKLPEDFKGTSAANWIKGELVTTVNRKIRAIIPEYGAFYAKSLVVKDMATGKTLIKGQYLAVEMYPVLTRKSGQEVCALILVNDDAVSNNLSIEYRAVGGENSYSVKALNALIEGARIDGRSIDFYDIQGIPAEFPVAAHQHDGRDIYGWDYVVAELNRLIGTVGVGSTASRKATLELIVRTLANVMNEAEVVMGKLLSDHITSNQAHTQYVSHGELGERADLVRPPVVQASVNGASVVVSGTPYVSFYGVPHGGAHVQVSRLPAFAALLVDRTLGAVRQYNVTETLPAKTQLFARMRYLDSEGVASNWSVPVTFTTA